MKIVAVKPLHAAPNGGAHVLEGIGPRKPASLISSSCIGKDAPHVAKPSSRSGPLFALQLVIA